MPTLAKGGMINKSTTTDTMEDRYLARLANENLLKHLEWAMEQHPKLKAKQNQKSSLENIRTLQNELIKRFRILEPEAV